MREGALERSLGSLRKRDRAERTTQLRPREKKM